MKWQTRRRSSEPDAIAPDGSQFRLLGDVAGASMVLCTLAPGQTSQAVQHRTVEEVWYCVSGQGELWRADRHAEEVVGLEPGIAVNIPLGARFQFRCTGAEALDIVIATAPPWPGDAEAMPALGTWPARV